MGTGTEEFRHMVQRAMEEQGLSARRVAGKIGELQQSGRVIDTTQISRIIDGRRRYLDQEIVAKLINTLGLDPVEAWSSAGLWPPDLTTEAYRQARHHSARRGTRPIAPATGAAAAPEPEAEPAEETRAVSGSPSKKTAPEGATEQHEGRNVAYVDFAAQRRGIPRGSQPLPAADLGWAA